MRSFIRSFQPGQSFDYNVTIPTTEPPGLYWYHPHPHGISEGQAQGGATGALIVEGLQNVIPALAGLPTHTFVIRDQILPASEVNDASIPAWDLSINYVPVTYPSYTPAVIQTDPGQQELWRVVNSSADTILNLQYVVNGTAKPMQCTPWTAILSLPEVTTARPAFNLGRAHVRNLS
jgi:FtsP/CotA-like multicopper oxidase with cupredoxin domain